MKTSRFVAGAAALLILALSLGGCGFISTLLGGDPASPIPASFTFVGTLRDTSTNLPVGDALVRISGTALTSNSDVAGHYFFGSATVAGNNAALSVSKLGYEPATATIPLAGVASGSMLTTDISLTRVARSLSSFSFAEYPAAEVLIDEDNGYIAVTLPGGTSPGALTALTAVFTTSGAGVQVDAQNQSSGTSVNDFSYGVTYTVLGSDGSTKNYLVQVTIAPSDACALTAFAILTAPESTGVIDETAKTVAVTVPYGTALSLRASFTTTGSSVRAGSSAGTAVTAQSGVGYHDYTSPMLFIVAAADGVTTATYTVTVTVAPNTQKTLTEFRFGAPTTVGGVIDEGGKTVTVTFPATSGANLADLVATFAASAQATVSVKGAAQTSGTTHNDFSAPLVYRVTAGDGTYEDYTVIVGILPSAPSNLAGGATSATAASLTWTSPGGSPTAIKVYRGRDSYSLDLVDTLPGSATSYVDPALAPNWDYYWALRAVNAAGDSIYSNQVFIRTPYASSSAVSTYLSGLYQPGGLATDGTYLYIADYNAIKKVTLGTSPSVTILAGGTTGHQDSTDGTGNSAKFWSLAGAVVDNNGTYLYAAESYSGYNWIRRVDLASGDTTTVAGGPSGSADGIGTAASFGTLRGLAIDGADRWLYVADSGNFTVRKVDLAPTTYGSVTTLAGKTGVIGHLDGIGTAALINGPTDIAVGPLGELYVSESGTPGFIRKIDPATGEVSTYAGYYRTYPASGFSDGPVALAKFSYIEGLTASGTRLYVTEAGSVREIDLLLDKVTILAGGTNPGSPIDGTGSLAVFKQPFWITMVGGNLYVVDSPTVSRSIRKVAP